MSQVVLCFGDSLTYGLQTPTGQSPRRQTPYGDFLQEGLGTTTVVTAGVCGEVTAAMVRRLPEVLRTHDPGTVVILGGTNDLGRGVPAAEVQANLVTLYDLVLAADATPVAVTVPSFRLALDPQDIADHLGRRHRLNASIAAHCEARSIALVDLFGGTADADGQLQPAFSNDGLHFSSLGYRRFADLVRAAL